MRKKDNIQNLWEDNLKSLKTWNIVSAKNNVANEDIGFSVKLEALLMKNTRSKCWIVSRFNI